MNATDSGGAPATRDARGSTKPHWYYRLTYCCPLCSRTTVYRERRYDAKPVSIKDRGTFVEVWDGCGV